MRTFLLNVILIVGVGFTLNAQNRDLKAYLDSKQFFAPDFGNYIEFHLQFVGTSINYIGQDNGLVGELAIFIDISKNNTPVFSDAYRLSTPFMKDSIVEDFYDVRRIALDPGNYQLYLKIQDINSKNKPLTASTSFMIEEMGDAISISDIEVAEIIRRGAPESDFFKSGYEIVPRLSTFYPEELNTLPVYFEVYNSPLTGDSVFGVKQTIINLETGKELEDLTVYSQHQAGPVVPILRSVPIDKITSGKYRLSFTFISRSMTELAVQSYDFERSYEPEVDFSTADIVLDPAFQESIPEDSLGFYLTSLIPISNTRDVRKIIELSKSKNGEDARKFIQLYWIYTSPDKPYEGWIKYKRQVLYVEKLYRTNFQNGFETDRGRVYLQYGAPSDAVVRENSPNEYPYEMWIYNKIGNFSNRRFIFYNPDLVNNTYRLLHSDMLGELKNNAWPRELVKRSTTYGDVDNPNREVEEHFGGNSNSIYRQY